MDQCSTFHPSDTDSPCYALVYFYSGDVKTYKCIEKKPGFNSTSFTSASGIHAAIARASQLVPQDTDCPYEDFSNQTTPNGLQFQINCGKDFEGNDMDVNFHADTLEECMEKCSTMQSRCNGVSWNPDLSTGYANCYPKSSNDSTLLVSSTHIVHTALASYNTPNATCNDHSSYISKNGIRFNVLCEQEIVNYDIISVYQPDFGSCIEYCSTYHNDSTPACLSVTYNAQANYGYQNCYVKSTADLSLEQIDTSGSMALLISNSTTSSTTSSNSSSTSTSDNGDQTPSSDSTTTSSPTPQSSTSNA